MSTRANYITGHPSEFGQFREGIPIHLETGGFLLCTSGSSDVMIDSKQYSIKAHDLAVAFPYSYVHALRTSDDFDGILLGVDVDLLINTEIKNKSFYITSVTENPCISLKADQAETIVDLRKAFLAESAKIEHPMRREIDDMWLRIIIYEVAALFGNSVPNNEHECSRNDIIFSNFIVQLYSERSQNRNLLYFAQRQSITPSHLSKVVKRVSGRTASDWISNYTIITIKHLLQNADLSIASIADLLNFPNASFLSQYFKKQTAQTPKQYRTAFFTNK